MSIFRRPDYTSEVTQFIDGLKAKSPRSKLSNVPVGRCFGTNSWTAAPRRASKMAGLISKPMFT